ncbi:eRF1 methyltransferase catalytic subunit [Novymonas esmeraldas]|uniref:ERF1 methyltransferase catalytic subunit n=1 Tax=Novymonas esmeraldas TaxID=1808958 RepID=A0AAW0F3J8_9TRYP
MSSTGDAAMVSSAACTYSSPEYTHCLRDPHFRNSVYEPEADTFLFLEALDAEAALLRALQPRHCVEVGCGSGTVITHLRCLLMPSAADLREPRDGECCSGAIGGPVFSAVDVNPVALEATAITWTETLHKHFRDPLLSDFYAHQFCSPVPTSLAAPAVALVGGAAAAAEPAPAPARPPTGTSSSCAMAASTFCLHRYQGDLLEALPPAELHPLLDVVLFNPPYVPTSLEELESALALKDLITAAWCGGPRGRVVLDRFLRQLPRRLSRRGVCYVVLIKENDVADVLALAQALFREHLRCDEARRSSMEAEAETLEQGDVLETTQVAARYTGEHLCVYRLRYLPRFREQ